MTVHDQQGILVLVACAALVRAIGILLLKVRQLRYRRRGATMPTRWQDLCTGPEPPLMGIVAGVLLTALPESPPSRLVLLVTLPYVLPAYVVYMRSEEQMLLAHFGEPYARYRERVGMLFPRLGARGRGASRPA